MYIYEVPMNKDKFKNLTVIDGVKSETEQIKDTSQNTYQSNPLKTDLYSRLAAFRNSQRKFNVQDVIKDSLK